MRTRSCKSDSECLVFVQVVGIEREGEWECDATELEHLFSESAELGDRLDSLCALMSQLVEQQQNATRTARELQVQVLYRRLQTGLQRVQSVRQN